MGATYEEYLTHRASVLICNDPQTASRDKLRHTSEWGVPAVSGDWFWISMQSGQKKSFEPYLVQRQVSQQQGSMEKPGDGFTSENSSDKTSGQGRKRPSSLSAQPLERTERSVPNKTGKPHTLPIVGDGFSKEEADIPPKPTIPESRSGSPVQGSDNPDPKESSTKNPEQDQSAASAGPSALDSALKGLLQQAQASKSRQQSESSTTNDDGSYPARRKRKPLLGRAPSHSSNRKLEITRPVSRASSIDTLNDDGLGSAIESGDPTRENSLSRTTSRVEQNTESLSSIFSGGKFDFTAEKTLAPIDNEDEENQAPQMTQLDYEDPDAAAMRAEFLRDAGKLVEKAKKPDPVAIGEIKELEDTGWGSGRRTRKQPAKKDDD
jgi:DNA replication regulator DPB11